MEPRGSLHTHTHTHRSLQPISILSQTNPIHVTFHFLKIHFNIILPSTFRSFKWLLPFRFPHLSSPATWRMSWADHPNNIWQEYRSLSSSSCSLLRSPATSSLLGPNILLNTPFLITLNLCSSLSVTDHDSHPHKISGYKWNECKTYQYQQYISQLEYGRLFKWDLCLITEQFRTLYTLITRIL